jgi:hypothetical protein
LSGRHSGLDPESSSFIKKFTNILITKLGPAFAVMSAKPQFGQNPARGEHPIQHHAETGQVQDGLAD